MQYQIEVTETLSRIISVEADNEEDAINQVQDQYDNEEIVLDEKDFVDVDISIYKSWQSK